MGDSAGTLPPLAIGVDFVRDQGVELDDGRDVFRDQDLIGNRLGPDEALRFAKGEKVISSSGTPASSWKRSSRR